MSPSKKQSAAPSASQRLAVWLFSTGRPLLIAVVLLGILGGGAYLTWLKLRPRILSSPEYKVGVEQIEITPLPPWIHSDVRAEAFSDPTLEGPLSLLDDNLVERIRTAFEHRPWVARVVKVSKKHPSTVTVEMEYRRPACMIEVPGGVLAVDADGVLLPSEDFTPLEANRYPRVTGVDRRPSVPAGQRWGDARVVGGAEIAAALGPAWHEMKLHRIEPLTPEAVPAQAHRTPEPQFVLVTRSGTRIFWGYAPGANMLGELPAAEKVARLHRHLAEHDTFDGPEGKPQELDVRTMGQPH